MRKLKLQMQVSVDGFVGGPNGEIDWAIFDMDEVFIQYVTALTGSVDTMVIGAELYKGMSQYWPAAENDPNQAEFAKTMNGMKKLVFSDSLTKLDWNNAEAVGSNVKEVITAAKNESDKKDLITYGGARLVASLIKEDLIDEYHLFVNPVAIGKGLSIWKELEGKKPLRLVNTKVTGKGIVILHYEPVR